jgi:hypothetical protein
MKRYRSGWLDDPRVASGHRHVAGAGPLTEVAIEAIPNPLVVVSIVAPTSATREEQDRRAVGRVADALLAIATKARGVQVCATVEPACHELA